MLAFHLEDRNPWIRMIFVPEKKTLWCDREVTADRVRNRTV